MKPRTRNILIALGCLLVGLSIGAATQERIRWSINNFPVYHAVSTNGPAIDFGLRSDGVVVWREIVPAATNSPAEQFEMGTITNIMMTNLLKPEWTNILIKPIYIPPWHHPEWTNWEEGARWWSNQVKPLLD